MAATFTVETGLGIADANAYIDVAYADQYMENFGNSTDWSGATTLAKEDAIRSATRYLDLHYTWDGYKVFSDQALQWPRQEMYDEDGNSIASNEIPIRVKDACANSALKVIEGDTLLADQENESKVKKTKDVVGPLTEEREYVHGESPDKTYSTVDKLVNPFIAGKGTIHGADIERA